MSWDMLTRPLRPSSTASICAWNISFDTLRLNGKPGWQATRTIAPEGCPKRLLCGTDQYPYLVSIFKNTFEAASLGLISRFGTLCGLRFRALLEINADP